MALGLNGAETRHSVVAAQVYINSPMLSQHMYKGLVL